VLPDKIRRLAASEQLQPLGTAQDAVHAAGDVVEYFSSTQNRWISAKVLSRSTNGTYQLDCKPDVPADKVRKPTPATAASKPGTGTLSTAPTDTLGTGTLGSVGAVDTFTEGDTVEYFGATLAKWIPAKVQKVNPDGTFDLDCKPRVPRDKIRRLGAVAAAAAAETFATGDVVEYFSATQSRWIPAKVLEVNPNGTYHLDCKPEVPADKIRRAAESTGRGPQPLHTGPVAPLASGPVAPETRQFQEGDMVEYFGATQARWIPAKVLKANANGTYDLDCKPGVPPEKLRALPKLAFSVGDKVEYYSVSLGKWVPAKVLAKNGNGTYDLDCKPQVSPASIRPPDEDEEDEADSPEPVRSAPSDGTGLEAATGLGEPLQLLRVVRGSDGSRRYELCAEGAAALERHGSRRIAVASICGQARTGKSLLMNLLLERAQKGFRVGSAERAGTEGLWIWGSAEEDDERSPLLAFLDCEGFSSSAKDASHDMHLMTLCSLLSSVVLLNSKGILNEDLFNALKPACSFTENLEEHGDESSRPSLMWVLRDFTLELRDAQGNAMTADEYLEKALHAAATAGDSDERRQSARSVRQTLMRFFKNRTCNTLVQPASEVSQLLQLDSLPYEKLRPEFRAGVEVLRKQLITTCRMNTKTVGGQPLGCFAFVALVRQLVAAMNDSRILNMKGAWETVQHTSCGALADELRDSATKVLHALCAGEPIPGGATLPLTDEALRAVLRDQRRRLKVQWEERAVGHESVRREYWQELKEALVREEKLVQVQNTRLADQQLMEVLRTWQEWLDNDSDAKAATADEICRQLGSMMERMPGVPLSRAGKAAVQAAVRRVAEAHNAVHATVEHHENLHREVVAQGEQHVLEENEARSQLDGKRSALSETKAQVETKERECQDARERLFSSEAELQDAKAELEAALREAAAARASEHETRSQQRVLADSESALRADLEQVRAAAARADAERLAVERCARDTEEAAAAEQQRLEAEVTRAKAKAEEIAKQLESERQHLKGENTKTRQEHQQKVEEVRQQLEEERNRFKGEKEETTTAHMRMAEEARKQLEEQRRTHVGMLDSHKTRLLENERNAGVLEGKLTAISSETEALRERVRALEGQLREATVHADQQAQQKEQTRLELEGVKTATERHKSDVAERLKAQEEEYGSQEGEVRERQPKCGCAVQ